MTTPASRVTTSAARRMTTPASRVTTSAARRMTTSASRVTTSAARRMTTSARRMTTSASRMTTPAYSTTRTANKPKVSGLFVGKYLQNCSHNLDTFMYQKLNNKTLSMFLSFNSDDISTNLKCRPPPKSMSFSKKILVLGGGTTLYGESPFMIVCHHLIV